ncbi:hypothetical protein V6N13_104427 [Hibiscus sabdariffa]|uniref:Uncharacterized protein n=1 Tax=Hibiscus sabdariffa TaxID=183260 RepID=A0ABR2DHT4_9ROSI
MQEALASHTLVREPPKGMEHIKLATHSHAPQGQGRTIPHPETKANPHSVSQDQGRTQANQHPPNAGWGQVAVGGRRLAHHTRTRPKRSMERTMASMGAKQVTHIAIGGKQVEQATRAGQYGGEPLQRGESRNHPGHKRGPKSARSPGNEQETPA